VYAVVKAEDIQHVAVVGAGAMGHGIAQILTMIGVNVTLADVSDEILQKASDRIKWSMEKFVEKRTIKKEEMDAALARLGTTTSYQEAAGSADLVIEAIPENLQLKKDLFAKIDGFAPSHAILASNTSTLSITEMAAATKRPDRVVGMHFFNPPQIMPLVEVIKGARTSDETATMALELAKRLGKTPILVKKDVRGFVVNGVLGFVFNEAFWVVQRGEATKEEVDAAVKYRAGFPMGIFELADYVGLDIIDNASKEMSSTERGTGIKIAPLVESLVKEGKLGQKSGEGFYKWTGGRPRIPFELADKFDLDRIYLAAINASAWLVHDDVASASDIDLGMKFGAGWPSGPCEIGDRIGLDTVVERLQQLRSKHDSTMYEASPLLVDYVRNGWLGRKSGQGFHKY
jgi:enoyl-CoA hydratase/3-hydroxyacyl-CoA dehydrogenase